MLFTISRTSGWDKKPCDEAFEKDISYIHVRTFGSFEEFDERFGTLEGKWLSKGRDHCVNEDGHIQRVEEREGKFVIELNSLEDLMAFYKKHGNIVLEDSSYKDVAAHIEIYDDYRE